MIRPRRAFALALLVLLLSAGWTVWRLLRAQDDLVAARTELTLAKTALLDQDVDAAERAVARAGERTEKARFALNDPIVRGYGKVPLVGRSIRVARGLAQGSDTLAREVLPQAVAVAKDLDPDTIRETDGRIDVAALQRLEPAAREASEGVSAVRDNVENLPDSLLIGQVAAGRQVFVDQVRELDKALRGATDALKVAPRFLGADRPRRWFVLVQQYGESRGTGGIPGGFAVLRASGGKLVVEAKGSNADLKQGAVPTAGLPKDFVDRYEPHGGFEIWQNVNLSPNLPVVAEVIARRWKAQGGRPIDGVVALDPTAIKQILRGSAPLRIGDKTVPVADLERYLAIDQYIGFRGVANQQPRKDRLAEVAGEALNRVADAGGGTHELLSGLIEAVRSGHARLAARDSVISKITAENGFDGALPSGRGPFVYPVVVNASGNKLDYFLDREIRYDVGRCMDGRRDVTISVTLTNRSPDLATLPAYITTGLSDGPERRSTTGRVILSVFGTQGSVVRSATLNGQAVSSRQGLTATELQVSQEAGLPVWEVTAELPPQRPVVLRLEISEPRAVGDVRIHVQPLAKPLVVRNRLPTCR